MADPASPSVSTDNLQFGTVEPVVPNEAANIGKCCAACNQPIVSEYYALGGQVLCPACSQQASAQPSGSKIGRLFKATVLGIVGGLIGAAVWYGVRQAANMEVGIIAIGVGFLVGTAVRKGSGDRGGRGYQVLAVLITYCSIAANYMPDVFQAFMSEARDRQQVAANDLEEAQDKGEANGPVVNADDAQTVDDLSAGRKIIVVAIVTAIAFAFSLALPFLQGVENIIGLLIIGIALWEAWKLNALRKVQISGPYKLGTVSGS